MITQEDDMGCGAACVAFIVHKPYCVTVEVLDKNKAISVGFQLKELVDGLAHFNLEYRFIRVTPHNKQIIYGEGTIVFIKRSVRYPYGHYIVRHRSMWADPWINLVTNADLSHAIPGFRKRLPGVRQWAITPSKSLF